MGEFGIFASFWGLFVKFLAKSGVSLQENALFAFGTLK